MGHDIDRCIIDQYCVQFVSSGGQPLKRVLVVGGPKDLGKSTGIFYTKIAVEDIKFNNTFSIDLIGAVEESDSAKILSLFAFEIVEFIWKNSTKRCIYQGLSECLAIKTSWKVVYDKLASVSLAGLGYNI